jgi:addiction module HigA family antidote
VSVPNTGKRTIRPTHPGEMLREDFMPDYRLTVAGLAGAVGVSRQTINELLRERRALSAEMALRLARLFGNSSDFWLNAQRAVDLWEAEQTIGEQVEQIRPLRVA